jgi:hypothetical protein
MFSFRREYIIFTRVKRMLTILLLAILLFNWGGYRLVTCYLEEKADSRLEASFDNNTYDEADLVSIKIPAQFPYYTGSASFERIDGEINIKGVNYKYVKRRIYKDTLELLCVPNLAKTSVQNARDDFFRMANDLVANNNTSKKSTGSHTHLSKFAVQDFSNDHHSFTWQFWGDDQEKDWQQLILAGPVADYLSRLDKPPQA